MENVVWSLFSQVRPVWPDPIDRSVIFLFVAGVIALPAIGYWCMVADFRAYLRALRGALIKVTNHFPRIPGWARLETPRCLRALDLQLPCTLEEVKRAYRRKAELMHPDRGGDKDKFLALQRHFEQACAFLQEHHHELAPNPSESSAA